MSERKGEVVLGEKGQVVRQNVMDGRGKRGEGKGGKDEGREANTQLAECLM